MKRFLLPLLAALALPTAVNSGDLGVADFETLDKESDKYDISAKNDRSQDFGSMRCGFKYTLQKCSVKFENGKLTVDDSKGITPQQVIFFDTYEAYDSISSLQIIYKDSEGIITSATFHTKDRTIRWHRFMKEFLYFINQKNKSITNDYF